MTRNSQDTDLMHYILPKEFRTRIAVCDDEQCFRDSITDAIALYSKTRGVEIIKDEFVRGEDLLKSENTYNIVFLDYKMDGLDGLETAKNLRKKDEDVSIVFLTSFTHFVYESFEVGTFRFYKKPLDVEKLNKALDDFYELFTNDYPLQLNLGRETKSIQPSAIMFLEADDKKCYINLSEDRLHCMMSMASIGKLIPKDAFYQVHKAFIVNFARIRNFDKEYIYFSNGNKIPISRKYHPSFREAYMNYVKNRLF